MFLFPSIRGMLPREGQWWLIACGTLFVVGWIKGINLLLLLSYMMLALPLLNLFLAPRQVRGTVGKRLPLGPLFAGEAGSWEVEVNSGGRRPTSGWTVEDAGTHHRLAWFQDRLESGQTVRFRAQTILLKRGKYELEPLAVRSLYPFGLIHAGRTIGPVESWVVLPALGRLDLAAFRHWLERMARAEGRLRRAARPSMIHQDDLHGLRPFRPGDSPRWIHWRTSARRNEKMVREFERTPGQNLILIVDPTILDARPGIEDARLEAVISLAATICWEWSKNYTDQLVLLVAGPEPEIQTGYCTREKALEMLRRLALVHAQPAWHADAAVKVLSRRALPDAPVLFLSARDQSPLAARLSAALGRSAIWLDPAKAGGFYHAPSAPRRPPVVAPSLVPTR
jgi:uncharacterized protein (DUF58 family)